MVEDFFSERADQSEVKARIVTKYFLTWASVIAPATQGRGDKLAYLDLFAGPGRYEDGSASTPLMILSKLIADERLREKVVTGFNDADENHTATLQREIDKLPGITSLRYKPEVYTGEVGKPIADYFNSIRLIPAFSFIDPFGYKGLSWPLVRSVIKDWGCDCVFFFNYSRINAGVTNPLVREHMVALFGEENFESLVRCVAEAHTPRERCIVRHLETAMHEAGVNHVLLFRFRNETDTRTTHYLVFVTKHRLGFEKMKDIMAEEGSHANQGVPSYEYSPGRPSAQDDLFERPLDELEDELVRAFAGRTLSMIDLYREHNLDRPFIARNYKDALMHWHRQVGRSTLLQKIKPYYDALAHRSS
jgi:three-Cys-motif partner protein